MIANLKASLEEQTQFWLPNLRANTIAGAKASKPSLARSFIELPEVNKSGDGMNLSQKTLASGDVIKQGNEKTCGRCREPANKNCSACHGIQYCGAICQKADWPMHKESCKGTPQPEPGTVLIPVVPPAGSSLHFSLINNSHAAKTTSGAVGAFPGNPHGHRAFLVKLQASAPTSPIIIYDETKEFTRGLEAKEPGYNEVYKLIASCPSFGGRKVYAVARREGKMLRVYLEAAKEQAEIAKKW